MLERAKGVTRQGRYTYIEYVEAGTGDGHILHRASSRPYRRGEKSLRNQVFPPL